MKVAKFIRRLDGWNGDARLYELSHPLNGNNFVVVSAVYTYSGPETFIFGCNEHGKNVDFMELDGSSIGEIEHADALLDAGYTVE